jgi:hypothetical protein
MWGNVISLCGKTVSSGTLQTLCFQALIQSRVSGKSIIALFTIGSYVHSYKFKICVHNSLQNNGMTLFVVKILAAGVRRAMDSNVLVYILSMQFGKFQRTLKSFEIPLHISSVGAGIYVVPVVRFIWHSLSRYSFIHIAATINSVIMIMYLHYYYYYYYYYFIYKCAWFIRNVADFQWTKLALSRKWTKFLDVFLTVHHELTTY